MVGDYDGIPETWEVLKRKHDGSAESAIALFPRARRKNDHEYVAELYLKRPSTGKIDRRV